MTVIWSLAELGQEYVHPNSCLTALRGSGFSQSHQLCEQLKQNVADGLCLLLLSPTCTSIEMLHGGKFNIYLSTRIFFTRCLSCSLENVKYFVSNTIYFPERLYNQVKPLTSRVKNCS